MTERVPADHDTISNHRVHLERVGRTERLRVPVPDSLDVGAGDVVRLSLEGTEYHAQVGSAMSGGLDVRGAFDNPRLARTDGEGTDHLQAWFDDVGLADGDPLLLDTVTPGFQFGLRRPGQRVVYKARDPPDSSLADIARDVER